MSVFYKIPTLEYRKSIKFRRYSFEFKRKYLRFVRIIAHELYKKSF